MFKPDKRLTQWYKKYNELYWDGKLPRSVDVGWDDELDTDTCAMHNGMGFTIEDEGVTYQAGVIRLDPKKHAGARDHRMSLLHEMIHVALFPYNRHGKKFKNEKRRLEGLGALDNLW